MGYSTRYELKIVTPPVDPIKELLDVNDEARYALNEDGSCLESAKWYEHEQDMKAHSERFPGFVFELKGEGEESGDIWKKYFCNGRMQVAKAEIIVEGFDPSKLR